MSDELLPILRANNIRAAALAKIYALCSPACVLSSLAALREIRAITERAANDCVREFRSDDA